MTTRLHGLVQPSSHAIDRGGRINHAEHFRREREDRYDRIPRSPPHRLREDLEAHPAQMIEAVADQMQDADLERLDRKQCCEGIASALKSFGEGDQDIANHAGFEILEDLQPEFDSLGGLDPNAQNVERSTGQQAEDQGNRLVAHRSVRHGAGEFREDPRAILHGEKPLQLPHRHAPGVHGHDLLVEAVESLIALGDQCWIGAAVAFRGPVDPRWSALDEHNLGAYPVSVIARVHGLLSAGDVPQVMGEFRPKASLGQGLFKRSGCSICRVSGNLSSADPIDQLRGNAWQGGIGRHAIFLVWPRRSGLSCNPSHTKFGYPHSIESTACAALRRPVAQPSS